MFDEKCLTDTTVLNLAISSEREGGQIHLCCESFSSSQAKTDTKRGFVGAEIFYNHSHKTCGGHEAFTSTTRNVV